MFSSAVLIALLCVQGIDAASVLRGNSAVKAVETQGINVREKLSGFVEQVQSIEQNPQAQKTERGSGFSFGERVIMQLIFGILYYFIIVKHYPMLADATGDGKIEKAKQLQELDEVSATLEVSFPNCILSWCCTGPRAAHTFHATGILDYWAGCVLMSFCPCLTLWIINSFTELNEKLQGTKKNICMGAICACCCSCCVVAQDAQTLDYLTGMETHFCSIHDVAEK